MSRRLIDADALKNDILKSAVMIDDRGIQTGYEIAIELIKRQPTIDAEPVRHGKWIDEGQNDDFFPHHAWRCSECGEHVLEIGVPWFKYCPNCGARMDRNE